MRHWHGTLLALALALALASGAARAERLLVGPADGPAGLREAIARAASGDVIEILPGTYTVEPAVVDGKRLTLQGGEPRPVLRSRGSALDRGDRAIVLVRGGDVTLRNLEFRGARAADADGAGVRLEGGRLQVSGCAFFDNEHGVLATHAADAELSIENSIFAQAPRVVGGLAHLLQVGRIARLSVSGSRFHAGFEGHLIKSSARETRITYNLIDDGDRGEASYEIDLPQAGLAWVVGNVIGQAATAQNHVLVAYGAQGPAWERNALYLAHNTFYNPGWVPAWFLRVWRDRLPAGVPVVAVNNLVLGAGLFEWGATAEFAGNVHRLRSTVVDPTALAFELPAASPLRGEGVDPRRVQGQDLAPHAEFALPVGTRALPAATHWSPGAFQR